MGNLTSHPFVSDDVDWNAYVAAEWRSLRARELDRLGGLTRPALAAGQSFSRKLDYLGANVLEQATEIQSMFGSVRPTDSDIPTIAVEKRRFKSKTGAGAVQEVAEWRIRVHHARKRALLVVLVCVRLRQGLKRPTRLRRMESFSYMIPLALGEDSSRFIEAQLITCSGRDKAASDALAAHDRITDELTAAPGAGAGEAAGATSGTSPDRQPRRAGAGQLPGPALAGASSSAGPAPQSVSAPPSLLGPMSPTPPNLPPGGYAGLDSPQSPRRRTGSPSIRIPNSGTPGSEAAMSPARSLDVLSPNGRSHLGHGRVGSGLSSPGPGARPHSDLKPSDLKGHKSQDAGQPRPPSPDTTLAQHPSSVTSADALSPTDSSASSTASCKAEPDAAAPSGASATAATAVGADATAATASTAADMPGGGNTSSGGHAGGVRSSGANSPFGRISEEGEGPERTSVTDPPGPTERASAAAAGEPASTSGPEPQGSILPPLMQFPRAGQRSGMLPLPGHRQRHVSESGSAVAGGLASPQIRNLPGRQSILDAVQARVSEAGAAGGGAASRLHLPRLRKSQCGSAGGVSSGGGDARDGTQSDSGANVRASARHRRKEREESARPGWNSLFRKPVPAPKVEYEPLLPPPQIAHKREARRSAPNLVLPSIPGAPRPVVQSARARYNSKHLVPLGGQGHGPGHPGQGQGAGQGHAPAHGHGYPLVQGLGGHLAAYQGGYPGFHQSSVSGLGGGGNVGAGGADQKFRVIAVPSMSRHQPRDPATLELLERARMDPNWAMTEDVRKRLLGRSFSAVEKDDVARADALLTMYVNRVNTAWTAPQQWSSPSVLTPSDPFMTEKSAAASEGHQAILSQLRRGRIAFWFIVGEDSLPKVNKSSSGDPASAEALPAYQDIWTADPYDFIMSCRPGLLHDMHDKVNRGYSYQSRALGSLALALMEIGGRDALSKTHIVLSVSDEQAEEVTQSLWEHKFFGFNRQNVIIIAQSKRPGYRYDLVSQRFLGVPHTAAESTGTGYAAMQLNWCPDAFTLSPEGLVSGLHGTTAEVLAAHGVNWVACYRARDLAMMEGGLDTKFLALGERLMQSLGVNMVTQAMMSESMGTARSLDSIILKRNGTHDTELRMAELSSHALDKAVEKAKADNNGQVAVGIQRYLFHLPSLKKNLVNNQDIRPKLRIKDGLLFIRYEISDLTSMEGASLAVVQVREPPTLLASAKDLDQLLAATQQQDNNLRLMTHLNELRPRKAVNEQQVLVQAPPPRSASLSTTVVFLDQALSSLPAVRLAVALARPTRDAINLCTFVPDQSGIEGGKAMLMRIVERLGSTSVQIRIDVVVRGAASLLDCMWNYAHAWKADMVVVTTRGLAKSDASAILGSVCLAIIKRLDVPVLIVTPKSAQSTNLMYDRRVLRMMSVVEGWSAPLLEFAVDRLVNSRRGDHLLLGQVCSSRITTKQQLFNMRRYMNDAKRFVDNKHVERVQQVEMDGIFETVVEKAAQDYRVNLLGIQLPPASRALPKSLIQLICTCSSAILVYKQEGQLVVGEEEGEAKSASAAADEAS